VSGCKLNTKSPILLVRMRKKVSQPFKFELFDLNGKRLSATRDLIRRYRETDWEKKDKNVKLFQFILPFVLGAVILALSVGSVLVSMGWPTAKNLLNVWLFYAIPLMGKEILIPKTILGSNPPPALLVGAVTSLIDVCYCLFLIWNYDWIKSVKYLGPKLTTAEEKGKERVARSKWFSKAAFIATTMFVLVPFKGAGGIGGAILGRIMGLKPYKVLLAVLVGSMVESLTYAFLSESISPILDSSPFFGWLKTVNVLQIFMVMVMIVLIIYVIRNPKKAVTNTAGSLTKVMDLAEEGVIAFEGLSERTTRFTLMSNRETIRELNQATDLLVDQRMDIITEPVRVLGPQGEQLALAVKERGNDGISIAKGALRRTAGNGLSLSGRSLRRAARITVVGLRMAKGGVKKGEYIVLLVGGHVHKVLRADRD